MLHICVSLTAISPSCQEMVLFQGFEPGLSAPTVSPKDKQPFKILSYPNKFHKELSGQSFAHPTFKNKHHERALHMQGESNVHIGDIHSQDHHVYD